MSFMYQPRFLEHCDACIHAVILTTAHTFDNRPTQYMTATKVIEIFDSDTMTNDVGECNGP